MKRFVVTCILVILVATVPLIAGTSKISLGMFNAFERITAISLDDNEIETEISATIVGAYIKGTNYFSFSDSLGISYMARFGKITSMSVSGSRYDASDEPIGWDVSLGLAIQQPVSYEIFIEGAFGLLVSSETETDNSESIPVTSTTTLLSFSLLAELNMMFIDSLIINVGVHGILPLSGTLEASAGGLTLSQDYTIKGFTYSPYVGVSFAL